MHVNDNCQPARQDHLNRGIQIPEILLGNPVCLAAPEHRLGIHAQPHVVKSHGLDRIDVRRRRPRRKMLARIALLVVNLRKPLAQIDAVLQMRSMPPRNAGSRIRLRITAVRHEKDRRKEENNRHTKTRGTRRGGCPCTYFKSMLMAHSLIVTVFTSV